MNDNASSFNMTPFWWAVVATFIMVIPTIEFYRSPDSIYMIDIAQSLLDGNGLATFRLGADDTSIPSRRLMFPPLYPILLAVLIKIGFTAIWAGRLITVFSFALTTFCFARILRSYDRVVIPAVAVTVWLMIAPRIITSWYMLSEPTFICITSVMLLFAHRIASSGDNRHSGYLLLGLIAGVATLCRWIGITLLIIPFLLLVHEVKAERLSLRKGTALLLTSAAVCGPVVLSYLLFQYFYSGHSSPMIPSSPVNGLVHNTVQLARSLVEDLLPLFVVSGAVLFVSFRGSWSDLRHSVAKSFDSFWVSAAGWAGVFLLSMVILCSIYNLDEINTRFTSPAYPILIFLLSYLTLKAIRSTLPTSGLPKTLIILSVLGLSTLQVAKVELKQVQSASQKRAQESTVVADWLNAKATEKDLIIGERLLYDELNWGIPILESIYERQLDLEAGVIAGFLDRFHDRFENIYYVVKDGRNSIPADSVADLLAEQNIGVEPLLVIDDSKWKTTVYQLIPD